ncbi:hypothetical protein RHGRI_023812 [Rhododendron griersonianum]|uniref:PPM-type phosphatase domain-containing protein n=1 Tax=Rhododendron griersonianum TaxID=479676 RepID=A0AAV6J4S0_9ERIC|nr:hypothetical protein RHGRI_023812 [Rhododendron griersonianum]
MSDESNSPANNENLSVESKDKQEGEFGDSGSVTKKPRTDDAFDSQQDQGSEASKEGTERNSYLHASSERKEENPSVNEVGFQIEAEAAEDKGSRHTMEDAWVVLPDASLDFPGKLRCAHYAIYDGHGGRLAAEYAQKHLHKDVLSAGLPRGWQEGATAVCVWVLGQTVFVANIGDAKAVVARSSAADGFKNTLDGVTPLKAIVLTKEHKAIYPQERARIQKAGGSVSSNGRLLGRLEVSRAFGDRQFKKVFGPSDAVEFVHKLLKEGLAVAAVSRRLVREAVRERLCKDNCTAIVIAFKHNVEERYTVLSS